jgi:hypothetical protein
VSDREPPELRRATARVVQGDHEQGDHTQGDCEQGDHEGRSRGIKLACCAGGSAPPQGDRKGPIPSSSPHPPLQRHGTANSLFVVFVRAGVVWSGVGTLAVALGWGCGCLT